MKKILLLVSLLVVGGMLFAGVSFAKAPANRATGTIWMDSPDQMVSFSAFDLGAYSDDDRGNVEYSNMEYPADTPEGYLHYIAPIMCVTVDSATMTTRFMYQIPEGFPGLSGLYVVAQVYDGGTPGTAGDTYGHSGSWSEATAMGWCETGSGFAPSIYPITAGNLVVHTY